jgi:hypothetical protein
VHGSMVAFLEVSATTGVKIFHTLYVTSLLVNSNESFHLVAFGPKKLNIFDDVWRIRDVYPRSRILIFTHPGSRILDPKRATKDRCEKIFFVKPNIWPNFPRSIEDFTQKIVTKPSKIWV